MTVCNIIRNTKKKYNYPFETHNQFLFHPINLIEIFKNKMKVI